MTDRLLRLDVENFRTLRRVSVPLGGLTVLVGPNGVGKTNVLKVFDFLADIIRTDLQPALDARGGFDDVAFWGGQHPPTALRIKLLATWTAHATLSTPDEYELTVSRRAPSGSEEPDTLSRVETFQFQRTQDTGRRITVSDERATVLETGTEGTGTESSNVGINRLSSGLSTLPRLAHTDGGAEVSLIAERLSSFRVFDVDVNAARRPARVAHQGQHLSSDAGNLADFLLELHQDHATWSRLLADAKEVLPHLEDIIFGSPGGAVDEVAVFLKERGLRRPSPIADALFGTVRLLGLLSLMYDPEPPALTCIEEIDHGLHPQALELLVERLREASERSQYLVATHSPALVDRLRPEEFVVCERDTSGASVIPAVSQSEVRAIVEESEDLPLGELWFSGALGGGL